MVVWHQLLVQQCLSLSLEVAIMQHDKSTIIIEGWFGDDVNDHGGVSGLCQLSWCYLKDPPLHVGSLSTLFVLSVKCQCSQRCLSERKIGTLSLSEGFSEARNATLAMDEYEYADVWKDSTKMKSVVSNFLNYGTRHFLDGRYNHARRVAVIARYLEQHIAVYLHQTQALHNWPKMRETANSSEFFRKRIPSCLDEKYREVKNITKISICFNLDCSIPGRRVERSRIMYCERCRCVAYCSRECWQITRRYVTNVLL